MKKNWLTWCFQWKLNIFAVLLVAIALVLTLSRILVVVLAHHPVFIEKWMSTALKRSVQIQSIQADWTALDPGITFKNVVVKNDVQQSLIQIKRLTLSIDIIRSLFHWKLLPGRLTIEGVNLDMNSADKHLQVRGILSSSENSQLLGHEATFASLSNWMLAEGNVAIKNVSVHYHSKSGETYYLHNLHLRIKNSFFQHRVYGGVTINKSHVSPTEIRFAAKLSDIDFTDAKFNANIYVKFHHLQLAQWANSPWLKPYIKTIIVKGGITNLELWADWHKTKITNLEGRLNLKDAETVLLPNQQFNIDAMTANFVWMPSNNTIYWHAKTIIFSLPRLHHRYKTQIHVIAKPDGLTQSRKFNEWIAAPTELARNDVSSYLLLLKNLKMQLIWKKDEEGLHFYVPTYQFHLFGLEMNGRFNLVLPSIGKPVIDFLSNCHYSKISQLSQFFSDRDPATPSSQWLSQAFLKGELENATIAYRGPIEMHPFQNREAHLSAEFQIRNLSFSYYFGWPVLTAINTNISVSDRQLSATFFNTNLDDNPIKKLQATMDDFLQPKLTITSDLQSNVGHVYQFIQDSPIASKKAPSLLPFQGPVDLHMSLSIDFSKPGFPILTEGNANVMGSLINFKGQVTRSLVHFNMHGHINFNPLTQESSAKLLRGISGNANFQSIVDVNRLKKSPKKMEIAVNTDMQDVIISGFPEFLDKKKGVIDPLQINITQYWKNPIKITLRYRDDIFMRLLASDKQHHFKLLNGEIDVGRQPSTKNSVFPGFVIYGKMAYFNWAVWKPFIMPFIHEVDGAIDIPEIFGLPLRYVNLQFKRLDAYHFSINNMYFKLIPRIHDWMFQMKSPEVQGTFFIPNGSGGTWAGHLDHLYIPKWITKKSKKKQKSFKINPRFIPPIDIEIKDLHYGATDYGHFQLRTRPMRYGIAINTFSIHHPLFVLQMKGQWTQQQHHQLTRLSGDFKTHDLGQVLTNWNIKNTLARGHGMANFQLSWPNGLDQFSSNILNGVINFNFHHGRILKMDEKKSTELSLGRILNAFSLEELPRRLTLHFSDITAKGLEFHVLKGKMKIKHGACKMNNTLLDSPVAKLKISGVINFPGKYYDLNVSVAPYVTSSLPLIVGIAGGPIAGAIAWVANKIATPEIGKMMGFVYHAEGSWDHSKDQKLPLPAETHTSHLKKVT